MDSITIILDWLNNHIGIYGTVVVICLVLVFSIISVIIVKLIINGGGVLNKNNSWGGEVFRF